MYEYTRYGAAGFIGSAVLALDQGHVVLGLDNMNIRC